MRTRITMLALRVADCGPALLVAGLAALVTLGLVLGIAGVFAHPAVHPVVHHVAPAAGTTLLPNWHQNPTAPGHGATVCFNNQCYNVDGNGFPYGQPVYTLTTD